VPCWQCARPCHFHRVRQMHCPFHFIPNNHFLTVLHVPRQHPCLQPFEPPRVFQATIVYVPGTTPATGFPFFSATPSIVPRPQPIPSLRQLTCWPEHPPHDGLMAYCFSRCGCNPLAIGISRSTSPLNQTNVLPLDSCEDGAEVTRRRYATHFIVSLLRLLAQSSRYKSISFW